MLPLETITDFLQKIFDAANRITVDTYHAIFTGNAIGALQGLDERLLANEPVLNIGIGAAFLAMDLLRLPVDIAHTFVWRFVRHIGFFPSYSVADLQKRGWTIEQTGQREITTSRGKLTIPVFTVTTRVLGDTMLFIPSDTLPVNDSLYAGGALPDALRLQPFTRETMRYSSPIKQAFVASIKTNLFAFIAVNALAQAIGDAVGIRISPLVAATVVLPKVIITNAIARIISTPIRFVYIMSYLASQIFIWRGEHASASPRIAEFREWIIPIIRPIIERLKNIFHRAPSMFPYNNRNAIVFSINKSLLTNGFDIPSLI